MKQGLLTLAGIALAVAAAVPAHALTSSIQTTSTHTFNLAQAYPCTIQGYRVNTGTAQSPVLSPEGIWDLRVWGGVCGSNDVVLPAGTNFEAVGSVPGETVDETEATPGHPETIADQPQGLAGAAPGTLCLARNGLALDVNCFVVPPTKDSQGNNLPEGFNTNCVVQAYFLQKLVPGSFKCPDVYGQPHFFTNGDGKQQLDPYKYLQYGTGVRTWWALNFTQPGTRFRLSVVSVCRVPPQTTTMLPGGGSFTTPGVAQLHKDVWEWRVVASPATLAELIEVMHGGAVSTLEVPCIIGEDMYDALKSAQARLVSAINNLSVPVIDPSTGLQKVDSHGNLVFTFSMTDLGNAIFDMEALIVSNCLFVDVLDPLQAFPGPPQFGLPNITLPGNLAQQIPIANDGTAIAGIIDTIENPCCCKLLVDLEYISIFYGIIGQVPHLPVVHAGGSYNPADTGA